MTKVLEGNAAFGCRCIWSFVWIGDNQSDCDPVFCLTFPLVTGLPALRGSSGWLCALLGRFWVSVGRFIGLWTFPVHLRGNLDLIWSFGRSFGWSPLNKRFLIDPDRA